MNLSIFVPDSYLWLVAMDVYFLGTRNIIIASRSDAIETPNIMHVFLDCANKETVNNMQHMVHYL